MASLRHVGDVIEVICEFDDSPTHLTTLRRVSWSFHRAVANVWTLLLGRQNSKVDHEQLTAIYRKYARLPLDRSGQEELVELQATRAALTALRNTVTFVALSRHWAHHSISELVAQLTDMPRLQSVMFLGEESLLQLAAHVGIPAQLDALLDRCPHLLSMPHNINDPALHCTARSGNSGCALVLLRHGCDPNMKDGICRTIAHIACESGHHAYLERIINAGYDVELSGPVGVGETPAHAAVHRPSTLQFLVDRGANVDLVAAGLGTPAFIAASKGAAKSLRVLLAAGAHVTNDVNNVPLVLAAYIHHTCLDVLGNAGVDLDVVDGAGETAAHRAARKGRLESLRTLHKHGANMFAVSNGGETPEQLAARNGCTECVEFLTGLRRAISP
jgi:ankyrin repeat protein